MTIWTLSPSDLTFLWNECPRCFYLKVTKKFKRPPTPFPKIFGRIDQLMKDHFLGKSTSSISPELPEGVVKFSEKWVKSQPITLPGYKHGCQIRGKFDTIIQFDDSSYAVIDFKTSQPRPSHVDFYSHQLHAYAHALENPDSGSFGLSPISKLGLVVVEPYTMNRLESDSLAYVGKMTWLECPLNDDGFLKFIDQVLDLLEGNSPPEPAEKCGYCQYRKAARETGF